MYFTVYCPPLCMCMCSLNKGTEYNVTQCGNNPFRISFFPPLSRSLSPFFHLTGRQEEDRGGKLQYNQFYNPFVSPLWRRRTIYYFHWPKKNTRHCRTNSAVVCRVLISGLLSSLSANSTDAKEEEEEGGEKKNKPKEAEKNIFLYFFEGCSFGFSTSVCNVFFHWHTATL